MTVLDGQPITPRSVTDPFKYDALLDFARAQLVRTLDEDLFSPPGRIVYHDTFEDTLLKWQQATGTVARDTTTAHRGSACLKLTTAAAAGAQAVARKFFQIQADQGFQQNFPIGTRQARIAVILWLRQADVNLREFHIRLVEDDTARQREWWWQFSRRGAGGTNSLNYLNSAGSTVALIAPYPIDDGSGTFLDTWNVAALEVDYNNGLDASTPPGYGYYRSLRIGDFISKPTPGSLATLQNATASMRNAIVDLVATSDNVTGTSVYVDDFWLLDLSAFLNQ